MLLIVRMSVSCSSMLTACGICYVGMVVRNGSLFPCFLKCSSLVIGRVVNYRAILKCDRSFFGICRITLPSRA